MKKQIVMLLNVFTGQYTKNTIQNISTLLKTTKISFKNNYLKNSFYKNKNEKSSIKSYNNLNYVKIIKNNYRTLIKDINSKNHCKFCCPYIITMYFNSIVFMDNQTNYSHTYSFSRISSFNSAISLFKSSIF